MSLALGARPKLARMARLRWDERDQRHMLLSPERGLGLSPSATRIVELCDGTLTVAEIIDRLAKDHLPTDRPRIEHDVVALLERLHARALVVVPP